LVNQKWEEPESNAKPTMWADMRSRMSREIQVRICGGPGGEIPLGYSTLEFSKMVLLYFRKVTHTKQRETEKIY
jgi:hypothetical protein